jgi:2-polyprenyl-3-methyl-5-hydroxy-6-metoxy-1,4-benzoquinol methylase
MSAVGLRRKLIGEIMDSPNLDQAEHLRALEGLRRINRASGTAQAIARPLAKILRRENIRRCSMLDVACGGGDVPIEVAMLLKQMGVEADVTLWDRSAVAVEKATELAKRAGATHQGRVGDAVAGLPEQAFDVVTNSLFLHHLTGEEVVAVLRNMRKAARRAVVISDLRRSIGGYVLAWVGCRVLSRSRVVHFDGPVSVRAAWTVGELEAMAREAGMEGVRVERAWPWRMMLVWERGVGNSQAAAAHAEVGV